MRPRNDIDNMDHYILPDQLRIGLYIYVGLPWFNHPFSLNNFKISSDDEIRNLRGLKVPHFRFDPGRSEAAPDSILSVPPEEPDEMAAENEPAAKTSLDSAIVEKNARIQRLDEHRKAITQMEMAFVKAAAMMCNLDKNLKSRPKETLEELGNLVNQMAMDFLDSPEVTLHVMGEKSGGEEVYYHSLNVSVLCMILAKELNLDKEKFLNLAKGALLHDIGLMEVPDSILGKSPDEYNKQERELRALHVAYGTRIGTELGLPLQVLLIIAQHHELADGSGYPQGLNLEQIIPLARIVSVVNFYDNLCNPLDISRAMTPHEALSVMFAKRKSRFDTQILQVMIRSLGVYPPGTIVKLTNDAIGMVVSVNPLKSLRPWVLIYDEGVPREEANMLNLEEESRIKISNAIRPSLLSPAVYAYLSPSKRIKYFFDRESTNIRNRP